MSNCPLLFSNTLQLVVLLGLNVKSVNVPLSEPETVAVVLFGIYCIYAPRATSEFSIIGTISKIASTSKLLAGIMNVVVVLVILLSVAPPLTTSHFVKLYPVAGVAFSVTVLPYVFVPVPVTVPPFVGDFVTVTLYEF